MTLRSPPSCSRAMRVRDRTAPGGQRGCRRRTSNRHESTFLLIKAARDENPGPLSFRVAPAYALVSSCAAGGADPVAVWQVGDWTGEAGGRRRNRAYPPLPRNETMVFTGLDVSGDLHQQALPEAQLKATLNNLPL